MLAVSKKLIPRSTARSIISRLSSSSRDPLPPVRTAEAHTAQTDAADLHASRTERGVLHTDMARGRSKSDRRAGLQGFGFDAVDVATGERVQHAGDEDVAGTWPYVVSVGLSMASFAAVVAGCSGRRTAPPKTTSVTTEYSNWAGRRRPRCSPSTTPTITTIAAMAVTSVSVHSGLETAVPLTARRSIHSAAWAGASRIIPSAFRRRHRRAISGRRGGVQASRALSPR